MTDIYDQILDGQTSPKVIAAKPDIYDSILDNQSEQEQQRIRTQLSLASKFNPDMSAQAIKLARNTGLPVETVERNIEDVKRQAQIQAMDMKSLIANSPILARQLSDPNFAKLAHDDIENTSGIEKAITFLGKDVPKSLAAGALSAVGGTLQGTADLGAMLVNKDLRMLGFKNTQLSENVVNPFQEAIDWLHNSRSQYAQEEMAKSQITGDTLHPSTWSLGKSPSVSGIALQGLDAIGQFAPQLALALGTAGLSVPEQLMMGGAMGFAQAYGGGAEQEYNSYSKMDFKELEKSSKLYNAFINKGMPPADAREAVAQAAAVGGGLGNAIPSAGESAFENWMLAALTKGKVMLPSFGLAAKSPAAATVSRAASGLIGGGLLGGTEEDIEQRAQTLGSNLRVGGSKELGADTFQQFVLGAIGQGVPGGIIGLVQKEQEAGKANQTADSLQKLSDLVAANKVLQRDPETFQNFIAEASKDGPVQHVYVDANALMQSGVADKLAQVSPAIAEQLPVAASTGGQIAIPIAEYATNIAPTEYAQSLTDHLKTEPDGFSRAEAAEYIQTQTHELQKEIETAIASSEDKRIFAESQAKVHDAILEQLNQVNRFNPQVNELNAMLIASRMATRASQLGITPEQMFEKQKLTVAEGVPPPAGLPFPPPGGLAGVGGTYNQVIPGDNLTNKDAMPGSEVDSADSRIIMQDGSLAIKNPFVYDDMAAGFFTNQLKKFSKYPITKNWTDSEIGDVVQSLLNDTTESFLDKTDPRKTIVRTNAQARENTVNAIVRAAKKDGWRVVRHKNGSAYLAKDIDGEEIMVRVSTHDLPLTDVRRHNRSQGLNGNWDDEIVVDDFKTKSIDDYLFYLNNGHFPKKESSEPIAPNSNGADISFNQDTNILRQSAFHGSPYHFDKFTLDHIGKGEGAQAYGWGLYFAGNKEVAEYYRGALTPSGYTSQGRQLSGNEAWAAQFLHEMDESGKEHRVSLDKAIASIKNTIKTTETQAEIIEYAKKLDKDGSAPNTGQLYEVNIPDDGEYLLWDKPLSEQSEKVRAAIEKINSDMARSFQNAKTIKQKNTTWEPSAPKPLMDTMMGAEAYRILAGAHDSDLGEGYGNGAEDASKYLNSLGIQGIKYLDGSSRNKGKGSYNYVIFDDKSIEILNKYYQGSRGYYSPSTNIITLLKDSDLSTFLHESGHFFFENDIRLANELSTKETLLSGEQRILDDVSALFKWHGIEGSIKEQVAAWNALTFEQQRVHHERFAEAFESYLLEGKAPSQELSSAFRTFKTWLLGVYQSLKKYLAMHPEAGKLNDEVRQVFDRMLATEEQIIAAEESRSMMPLFVSAEDAGMSQEEYDKYRDAVDDATQKAIELLQAKGIRDMQWLQNARSKKIKELQEEAENERREIRFEVKREVMQEPVYQAWQFLTGKISGDDKIIPLTPRKSQSGPIDNTIDSLFVAIAKLGGIDREEVIKTWGVDKKDNPNSGLFGKPVWRANHGRSIDDIAEALGQYEYLNKDGNGKIDSAELEEKFKDELRGESQYSIAYIPDIFSDFKVGEHLVNPGAMIAGRLDMDDMRILYGLESIEYKLINERGMIAKNGLTPDLVAAYQGFESGDDMVRQLVNATPLNEEVNRRVDAIMMERHSELSTPKAIASEANKAIYNDLRAKVIATEANVMAQATGQRKILLESAKEAAANVIAQQKIRNIKPTQYSNSASKAAKAAEKAKKASDIARAANEKRNELFNTVAAKAAYDALEEVDKGINHLKRITSTTALNNMRGEAKAQMLAILDRFDIRKSLSLKEIDRNQNITEWVQSEAERLAAPVPKLSPEVANETVRTHYKNLSMEQFRGLMSSVKQLEHMARREQKAYITLRNMSIKEEVAKGVDEIRQAYPEHFDAEGNAKLDTPLTHQYAPTILKNVKRELQHLNAEFIPMEDLIDQLTSEKFGQLHDSLFGRLSDASDNKAIMAGAIRDRIKPAYDAYSIMEKRDFARRVIPGTNMTRENIVMLALYYGNEEGRQRLASQGFGDQQITQRLAHLTEKDLNLIEAIWSLNDEYIWPMYKALNERTQGIAPQKVNPAKFTVNGRALNGGYVKLVYDSQFDEATRHRDSMDDAKAMISGRANPTAKTEQGSSKERISELSKMPLLELRAVNQAVNEHMHDIAYREAVADTVRLLRERDMRNAIMAVVGKDVYTELLAKVNEVAARPIDPSSKVLKALNIARRNTIVVLMSGVKTALVNYSGLIPALTRVNAGSLVKSIAKVHSWRMMEMVNFAKEKSTYMRERNEQFTSDMQHEMASLTMQNSIMPEMGSFLILMRMVDQITSTTVWSAAYEDGLKRFKDDARAVEYANNVVRSTQGSGRDVDTSKIMTRFGPWSKPFIMFYSFFNRQLSLLVRQGVISEREWNNGNKAKAVGTFTAAYIAIVVIPAMINDIAGGKCDKANDAGGWTKCISKAITMNMAGFVPVLRDVAPYAWGLLDKSEPDFGLRMTALSAYFEGFFKGVKSTVDMAEGHGDDKDTKAIFMGLAFSFGLPGKLMWDTAAGTEAVINKDAPPQAILFGPPKK